jgi:hypothetical protein
MSLKISVTAKAIEDSIAIAEFLAERSGFNISDRFLNATTQV